MTVIADDREVRFLIGAGIHRRFKQASKPIIIGDDGLLDHRTLNAVCMARMIQMRQMDEHHVRLERPQDIAGAADHHMIHKGLLGLAQLMQVAINDCPRFAVLGSGGFKNRARIVFHAERPDLRNQIIHIRAGSHAGPTHGRGRQTGALCRVQTGFHLQIPMIPIPVRGRIAHIELLVMENAVAIRRRTRYNGGMRRIGEGRIYAAHARAAVRSLLKQFFKIRQRFQKLHILIKERINRQNN